MTNYLATGARTETKVLRFPSHPCFISWGETEQTETKRNKSKRNGTKRNETEQIETERNGTKKRCVGQHDEVAALVGAMVEKGSGHGPDFFTVDVSAVF